MKNKQQARTIARRLVRLGKPAAEITSYLVARPRFLASDEEARETEEWAREMEKDWQCDEETS